MSEFHTSVLLQESISFLKVRPGEKYIDATIGGGGHAFEILKRGGKVLGIDVDEEAIAYVKGKFKIGEDLVLVKGNFRDIGEIARSHNFGTVSGIIFDLGASSYQFDQALRGFSFGKVGPLDMRMDRSLSVKAADLVNGLTKRELYELFRTLGEERYARTIADSITRARRIKPIETTSELAQIVEKAAPRKEKDRIHPATRVFQALRIVVNDERNNIRVALPGAYSLLTRQGRMVVISFHSLEDRIVKNAFKKFTEEDLGLLITKKPIIPTEAEVQDNRRARSAKLRVIERK